MTGQTIISRWRTLIADERQEYRYDDTVALEILNSARQQLAEDRADLLIDGDGVLTDISDLSALSEDCGFPTSMLQALAHLCAQLTYEREGNDETNLKLAEFHRQRYQLLS